MREAEGLAARRAAGHILHSVLRRRRPLDEALADANARDMARFADRDRALARMIAATALRRLGTLRRLLGDLLDRGAPPEAAETALLIGAAQILFLDVPDHAAVDLSVRLVQEDPRLSRYSGLVNAVLRRLAREGAQLMAALDTPALDAPAWLQQRWAKAYGRQTARAIAAAHQIEPPLDLEVKKEPQTWASRLGGTALFGNTVRLVNSGPVAKLDGYAEGAWWVQDAAAGLAGRLLGDVRGKRIADLCAAPGGKTAQLANAGAIVTAVDRSEKRLLRLKENLARLRLEAEIVVADAAEWAAEPFDAILLDAPCSSTGTIRRHPDIQWLKTEADLTALVALQSRLLDHAITLLKPGGALVYCTCSLEPEEGEQQIENLLRRGRPVRRDAVTPAEAGGHSEFINAAGELRTLPCHLPNPDSRMSGLDGFFAARLRRL